MMKTLKHGKPVHNFWHLVLTYSVEEAERIAAKEAPRDSEKFLELVRDLLKTPNRKEWQLTPATDFRPIEAQAIAERRNIGLIVSRLRELRPDLSLMCLDIDALTPKALAFAEHCGRRRAFVYRTRRGLHIWLQVRGVGGQFPDFPAQVEGVIVEGMLYPDRVDVFFTARKQILLPVAGTPRGDECEILWAGGVNLEGKGVQFSLSAILAAFETLPLLEVMIPAEVAPRDVQGGSGTWARIFGEGWRSMPLEKIAQRVREAIKGERNETLFHAAILSGYRGFEFEKVEAALLEAAKFVFGYGDPEFAGGTFRGARDTIQRGFEFGQKLAEQRDGGHVKRGRGDVIKDEGADDDQETEKASRRRVVRAVEFLKEQGALICTDSNQEYVLYRGEAIPLGTLFSFCLQQPEPQLNTLSRHDQTTLEQIAARELPRGFSEEDALIVRRFVRSWQGGEFAIIKISKKGGAGEDLPKEVKGFIDFLTRCGLMTAEEAQDLLQEYGTAPEGARLYIVEARCVDEEGGRVLKLYGHPAGQPPEGVYVPADLEEIAGVQLKDFAKWAAATVLEGRESESALKEFAPVLRAVLRGEPFQMTLATWAELPRSYLAKYLLDLARYHSNSAFWAYQNCRESADAFASSRELIARSLIVLTPTAFARGVLLIRGDTGAGKSILARRLAYAINVEKQNASTAPQADDVHALTVSARLIDFEEARILTPAVEEYIKAIVTGGEPRPRKKYTQKATGAIGHEVSFIINTVHPIDFKGDFGRRTLGHYVDPPAQKEIAGMIDSRMRMVRALDTISIAALRAVALSEVKRFEVEWAGWAAPDISKPPKGFPEWAAELVSLEFAIPYVTAARAFGVPDEIAERVLTESKEVVFEHVRSVWLEFIKLVEATPPLAGRFTGKGMTAGEVAQELQRSRRFTGYTRDGLAKRLGKELGEVAELLKAQGWQVRRVRSDGAWRFKGSQVSRPPADQTAEATPSTS